MRPLAQVPKGRTGCVLLRTSSVYQPVLSSLRTDSAFALQQLDSSRFIRNYNQLNYRLPEEKLHICHS